MNENWERWRGQIDARLADVASRMDHFDVTCNGCRSNVNGKFDDLAKRIQKLEIKVAWLPAVAALTGSIIGGIVGILFEHMLG